MKGIIIYRSRYGATALYADWIAGMLGIQVFDCYTFPREELSSSDFIIICSSVYVGRLLIKGWIKQYARDLQNKKLYLVVVCATPSTERAGQEKILKDNIDSGILRRCEIFFLPGRLIIEKLSRKDRFLLRVGSLFVKDPVKKAAMRRNIDAVKKENIDLLVKRIGKYASSRSDSI